MMGIKIEMEMQKRQVIIETRIKLMKGGMDGTNNKNRIMNKMMA